jgi:hypothetical protein
MKRLSHSKKGDKDVSFKNLKPWNDNDVPVEETL